MNVKFTVLLFALLLASCSQQKIKEQRSFDLMAIAYHRYAAETKALQYQAFNTAKDFLSQQIKQKSKKPKAVILDIDETILDNAPYQVEANIKNEMFPIGWYEWTGKGIAPSIPGAKEFLNFAEQSQVTAILVTNRSVEEKEATLKNLKEQGLEIPADNIYFKTDVSSKETRRQAIAKNYHVVMLIGDNLADFDALYDQRAWDNRNAATDKLSSMFGRKYIILPNPMYGDWEGSLYNGKFPKTAVEKEQTLKNLIKTRQ